MNIRSTLLMFALSIGALWLFGLMLAYKRSNVEQGLILPTFKSVPEADVETVTLQIRDDKQNQDLEFYQDGGTWTFGKNKIRIDSFNIRKILDNLRGAVKNDEERVPANSGVDNPRIIVTIKAKGGKGWQVKIGKSTNEKSFDFVKTSDLPQVVAVAHDQIEKLFFTDVNEFRSRKPFTFSEAAVKRIDVKQAGDAAKKEPARELEIKKTDDDLWKAAIPKDIGYLSAEGRKPDEPTKPKKGDTPAKPAEPVGGVNLLLRDIKDLNIDSEDLVPVFNDKDVDLAKYGLEDGKEKLRVEVVTSGGLDMDGAKDAILLVGNKDPEKDKYFARMAGDLGVFRLSGKSLEPIRKAVNNPEDLRSRDVVFTNADKFDLIRIKDRKEYLLSHPAGLSWSMFADGKWAKANETAVKTLRDAVAAKGAIVEFAKSTVSDSELGLDPPRMSIFLTADAKPKEMKNPETKREEKKDEGKKDEGKKDEGKKDEGKKNDGKKDEGKKDEGKKDEGKKDDKSKAEEKFALEVEPGVLERKDWSTEAVFKTRAASVSPLDDKQTLIKAEAVDGKIKFTQSGDAPDKEDKTVEFKVLGGKDGKDEVFVKVTVRKKPTVTLVFGKLQAKKVNDKEVWSVKRILDDGTEHRFYLAKDLVDKIIPEDVYLAFLDNTLPKISADEVTEFTLKRTLDNKKVESLEISRTKTTAGWHFKLIDNKAVPESENLADAAKVQEIVGPLGQLRALKWVQEIDGKTDLKQFDLDPPRLTVTMVVKKVQPQTMASIVGLGTGPRLDAVFGSAGRAMLSVPPWDQSLMMGQEGLDKGQTVTVRFGKEGKKDNVEGVYALFTVEDAKDVKKEDRTKTNDLLFLVEPSLVERLKKQQFHDRGEVLARQGVIDARAVGAGPAGLLAYGPFMNPALLDFDASKVEKITIDTRWKETRSFVFVRDQKAPSEKKESKENKDGKDNKDNKDSKDKDGKKDSKDKDGKDKENKETKETKEKSREPVSLKGQTWTWDQSPGLKDFHLDSEKVNKLVEKMARVDTDKGVVVKLASYGDGPRAYQKLLEKEATIRMVIYFEGKQPPITLSVGAQIVTPEGEVFRFAKSSASPQEVFLLDAGFIENILKGTDYFGKVLED